MVLLMVLVHGVGGGTRIIIVHAGKPKQEPAWITRARVVRFKQGCFAGTCFLFPSLPASAAHGFGSCRYICRLSAVGSRPCGGGALAFVGGVKSTERLDRHLTSLLLRTAAPGCNKSGTAAQLPIY
ncbi:unnamed protein product [Ectocarpus sp. 12 AP-2014]